MFIPVTHCTTTTKESACRIICILRQQSSPKRWFANRASDLCTALVTNLQRFDQRLCFQKRAQKIHVT